MVRLHCLSGGEGIAALPPRAAIDLGVAFEYFHTASLIFDDLPAMDNAFSGAARPLRAREIWRFSAMLAALALINRAYALTWRVIAQCTHAVQAPAMHHLENRSA